MLTAVCAFTEHPKDLIECRAAEERAREELAAVRAAAAAAAAHGMDAAVAKAPEPRSAVIEAELWRVRYTATVEVQLTLVLCKSPRSAAEVSPVKPAAVSLQRHCVYILSQFLWCAQQLLHSVTSCCAVLCVSVVRRLGIRTLTSQRLCHGCI